MALKSCKECGHEVSVEAPLCPNCGSPNPAGDSRARRNWRELKGPTFGRLTGATFTGVLLWSLLPLILWIFGMVLFGAAISGAGG